MFYYFFEGFSFIIFLFIFLDPSRGSAEDTPAIPPVDITLLMIELKYDEHQGVKICELQPICHSTFNGCDYIYQKKGLIGHNICEYLSQFGNSFWFMNPEVSSEAVRELFLTHQWRSSRSLFQAISQGDDWVEEALHPPYDSNKLLDYPIILYAKIHNTEEIKDFYSKFPGMVLIDKAFVPYMYDKYKQSLLFNGHPLLKNIKPRWGLFPKRYTAGLANEIKREIPTDKLVIKPRSANCGKGVIIVHKDDLDKTLKIIFSSEPNLQNHPDRGYHYWSQDPANDFLVEEFIETDPIFVEKEHNAPFDVTYRLAVSLIYQEETIYLHYLGGYCNISEKSLWEEGTLNEKHKTSLLTPRSIKTPLKINRDINRLLTKPLLILYKRILGFPLSYLENNLETSIITECNLEEVVSLMKEFK